MKRFYLLMVLMLPQVFYSQFTNKDVIAKINVTSIDDVVKFTGTATNQTEVYKSLKYTFTVFRTDTANNISKNDQEGRFTLEANEVQELSSVSINSNEKDKIIILLLIYEDDQIIGKDRVSINEERKKEKEIAVKEDEFSSDDGIELKGIVVEETKTKPGRDFYEYFYNSYSLNQINGNKIVGVYETLSFGRTTIIQVKIEDQLIHEFIGKPDLEYLEQMSKVAIRKVFKYFKDLKEQKNTIFQF